MNDSNSFILKLISADESEKSFPGRRLLIIKKHIIKKKSSGGWEEQLTESTFSYLTSLSAPGLNYREMEITSHFSVISSRWKTADILHLITSPTLQNTAADVSLHWQWCTAAGIELNPVHVCQTA